MTNVRDVLYPSTSPTPAVGGDWRSNWLLIFSALLLAALLIFNEDTCKPTDGLGHRPPTDSPHYTPPHR